MDQLHGVYTGVVVDTNDPQGRGRVRLQIPQVAGLAVTAWALPAAHGVAEVGDQVSVAHDGSDRNYPVFWPVRPVPVYVPPVYVPPSPSWTEVTNFGATVYQPTLGDWARAAYAYNADGTMTLRGLLFASAALANGATLCTVPAGPVQREIFPVATSLNGSAVKVRIGPDGVVLIHDGGGAGLTWVSLAKIQFDPQS